MSTFSSSNYTSADYAKYRPTYPESFFHYILKNAKVTSLQSLTILDIGCGPGTCFTTLIPELINILKDETNPLREVKLIASDLSQTMLNEAERKITPLLDNVKEIEVKYLQGKAEEVGKHIAEHSVDLVIAAECIHWVDAERFLNGIHQILREGATLAYWAYSDSVFIKVGDANGETLNNLNNVHDDFVYGGEGKLGSYWEQPGRERLRKLYVNVNEIVEKDTEHWDGVIKCIRDPSQGNAQTIGGADEEALKMQMTLPFSAYLKYADTWSAAFRWNESHSEEQRASRVFHDVLNKVVNIDYDEEVTIEMRTVYMIAHSK
jgi:SAM-dependent methyltransferase